ncbi:hypothetical protein G6660_09080 [Polynucleobacter paneuropaeus]|nr:hypothetical protein [Polynucleobacter paneuropaeus]
MKDWKSDLLAIKELTPKQNEIKPPETKISNNHVVMTASSIKPIELERKILALIRRIEALASSLSKVAPYPLVKGNSKKIKQYQNEIKILKDEFATLSYKFKPSLVSGARVPNTNALLIEMKDELLQREARYQNQLLREQQLEHEKMNNERQLKLEKERAEAEKRNRVKEQKQKELENKKELLSKKADALIKQCDIIKCDGCNYGNIVVPCDKCFGTKRLSHARKGIITERFSCGNLKPNCQFCGGLGVFSKQKEGLTYECDACTNGKQLESCKSCKGTGLYISMHGRRSKKKIAESLELTKDLIEVIQKKLGK